MSAVAGSWEGDGIVKLPFKLGVHRKARQPVPVQTRRRCGPTSGLETLEGRTLFASYNASTVADLITAINAANASTGADTITLSAGKTFSLTAVDHNTNGATGLPAIVAGGGPLTILGNGDTIERSAAAGTPGFRLF